MSFTIVTDDSYNRDTMDHGGAMDLTTINGLDAGGGGVSARREVTDPLILELMAIQQRKGITLTAMADLLMVNRATWSQCCSGEKRHPTAKVIIGALIRFPGTVVRYGQVLRKRTRSRDEEHAA